MRIPVHMSLGRFSSTADFSTLARASDNRTFREHPLTGHWSASLRKGRADTEHPPRPLSYGFFTAARAGTGRSSRSSARTSLDAGRSRSRLKVVSLRFSDQQSLFSSDRDCKGNGIDFNSNLAILRVVRPCGNQLRVWWRWHRREQHSDCSNVWLAAFKASTEIERAALILVGPDRSIATAYGDEGDHVRRLTQSRRRGELRRYASARVNAIGPVGGIDAGRPVARRLDQGLSGHLGTSQLGRRIAEVEAWRLDAVSFPDALVADARTAKCDGFVKAIDYYDAMGATGEGDGGRREGAEDVDDNCCADRCGRTAGQTR